MAGSYGKNRKEREKQRRTEEILLAAEFCFAQKGFHECTMEDIAQRAESSVGGLYNFFGGKEEIYQAMFYSRTEKCILELLGKVAAYDDPYYKLKAYVKERFSLAQRHRQFLQLYMRDHLGDRFKKDKLWTDAVSPLIDKVKKQMLEVINQLIDSKIIRNDFEPECIVGQIDYCVDFFLDQWFDNNSDAELLDNSDVVLDFVFNGIGYRQS